MGRIQSLYRVAMRHKVISALAIIILTVGGRYGYQTLSGGNAATRYAFAQVTKGTLIVSISGSGQVSALNQVDIKPKTSGEITAVYATPGAQVTAGQRIAQIDARDATRALRDAETALETAKLELDKTLQPVDELTLVQSENSLAQAQEAKQNAEDNLQKAYEDGFNATTNAFLALPDVMTGLQNILYGTTRELSGSTGQWNVDYYMGEAAKYNDTAQEVKNDAIDTYHAARVAYDANFTNYKSVSRYSDAATIEALINQSYDTTKLIAEATKSATNLIQFYQDELTKRNLIPIALSNTHLSNLNSYTGTTNNQVANLLSITRAIKDSKDSMASADRTIHQQELSLAKTKQGADDLTIRAQRITVQQKQDALTTAQQDLADTVVRAPFAGILAKVGAKKGDTASAGTTVATIVTQQKVAEISLNEIDVAKIQLGQKVTLTFDAIPNLTIAGEVAEVDAIGTVAQGVVTYTTKITFDTQDERVKPGMSVSAAIITDAKPDVLLIPNSAIKSQGGTSYVEVPTASDVSIAASANAAGTILGALPVRQSIEVGIANDESTEVTNGLKEGDLVVSRTIQSTAVRSATTQSTSGLRIPGITGGGSAGFRGGQAPAGNR